MRPVGLKQNIPSDAFHAVNEYLCAAYGAESPHVEHVQTITRKAFKQLIHKNRGLRENQPNITFLNTRQKKALLDIVKQIVVSPETPWTPSPQLAEQSSRIKKIIYDIMRGDLPPAKKLLSESNLLKAVIWKTDPILFQEGRELIHEILTSMCAHLNGHKADTSSPHNKDFHFEEIIGDLLSLYPYMQPVNGGTFLVPIIMDGQWQAVAYTVQEVQLTPDWMGSPLVAYGLTSLNPKAPPLLLFKGTTYPADSGFALSLLTDINPGDAVGAYAFRIGKAKIQEWLQKHARGENKAIIYGKSLGGAQACRTALYFRQHVRKVMAYGAPGFSLNELRLLTRSYHQKDHPLINVFCQKGDRVPYVDRMAEKGIHYYQILGEKKRSGFLAHADIFSTHRHSAILRLKVPKGVLPWKRLSMTALRFTLSIFLFPFFIIAYAAQNSVRLSVGLIDRHVISRSLSQGR